MKKHSTSCRVFDLGLIPYGPAYDLQKKTVQALQDGTGGESFFLLEHPHVVTIGRNASGHALLADETVLADRGVEVTRTDRGGDVTYHGPGQLVGYPIVALEPGRRDIRRYVNDLEEVLLLTLAEFGIRGERHPEHRGVWTGGRKIASVGIRISRWVTCHGFALNVSTDLSYYSVMNPCGITGCEMTSMSRELSKDPGLDNVKKVVVGKFSDVYDRFCGSLESRTAGEVSHT
jgi:lipoate-protein ligase B